MAKHIRLTGITLSSGDSIDVATGVTAIVGPNNTGKSSILRQLREHLSTERHHWTGRNHKVVDAPVLEFIGSYDDQIAEIKKLYTLRPPGQYSDGRHAQDTFRLNNGTVLGVQQIQSVWGSQTGLGALGQYFATYLDAESRLNLTGSTQSYDRLRELPSNPLQVLFGRKDLEARIANLAESAFKSQITVNRHAASMIHLHAGATTLVDGAPPASDAYLHELNGLPLLHEQGDGMRAFVGMLMAILTGQTPLVLIDEPEAFLHPPQARMFGKFLADYASNSADVQIVIATHSEDIVSGLTSVTDADNEVTVARVTRNGDVNHVAQLAPSAVSDLYADPLMKHYDMLNGLFSTGVVLGEADSDCTYFRAVVDASPASTFNYVREAHFTHAGGKARLAKAISAFRAAAVPVAAIFDIDILQNGDEFDALVAACGADATALAPLRNSIVSAVSSRSIDTSRAAAKAEVLAVIDGSKNRKLSASEARKIQSAVAPKSGWKELKVAGKSLLSGDALAAFNKLQEELARHGVFIVEQGELERLHPEVPQSNKAAWLRDVIDKKLFESSPAAALLEQVSGFLESAQAVVEVTATTANEAPADA